MGNALTGFAQYIERVGSTEVPNLDTKSIIEIDIIHQSHHDSKVIKSKLINLRYNHHGNQGIEKREVFKRTNKTNNVSVGIITYLLVL